MTQPILELCLGPTGRQLTFVAKPGEKVCIYRRAPHQSQAWELVARNASSPFVDPERFPLETVLEYHAQFIVRENDFQQHSHIARVAIT